MCKLLLETYRGGIFGSPLWNLSPWVWRSRSTPDLETSWECSGLIRRKGWNVNHDGLRFTIIKQNHLSLCCETIVIVSVDIVIVTLFNKRTRCNKASLAIFSTAFARGKHQMRARTCSAYFQTYSLGGGTLGPADVSEFTQYAAELRLP